MSQDYDDPEDDYEADPHCHRCGASLEWESCWYCMGAGGWHDCGEDCCPCSNGARHRQGHSRSAEGHDMSRPKPALPPITEAEFQRQVLALAKIQGWLRAHFRPARTKRGWRTAVAGDGKGFPDLVLLRGRRLVVAELKVGRRKTTPEQDHWLDAFRAASNAEVFVWRPRDWPQIEEVLE